MYRKKLKSNLNSQTPTTSSTLSTFRRVIHSNSFNNPVQSASTTKQDLDFSLNDSTFLIRSRITNLNSTTITTTPTNGKRKSLFSDFDLSDIKLDDSFKSFSKLSSTMMIIEKSPILERKSPRQKFDESSINLDDIDFDDDLLSASQLLDDKKPSKPDDSSDHNNNDSNDNYFTDADTDAMVELVNNNLLKSPDNKKKDTAKKIESKSMDNFDHLLDDDDDFDLDDLDDIEEIFVQIQNDQQTNKQNSSSSISSNQMEENLEFEFKTANGQQCSKPSEIHYKRTRSLFRDIEELLAKEICGYRKIQQQQEKL